MRQSSNDCMNVMNVGVVWQSMAVSQTLRAIVSPKAKMSADELRSEGWRRAGEINKSAAECTEPPPLPTVKPGKYVTLPTITFFDDTIPAVDTRDERGGRRSVYYRHHTEKQKKQKKQKQKNSVPTPSKSHPSSRPHYFSKLQEQQTHKHNGSCTLNNARADTTQHRLLPYQRLRNTIPFLPCPRRRTHTPPIFLPVSGKVLPR